MLRAPLAALFVVLCGSAAAQQWVDQATISPTAALVNSAVCYSDGRDIACDSSAGLRTVSGTLSIGSIGVGNLNFSGTISSTGTGSTVSSTYGYFRYISATNGLTADLSETIAINDLRDASASVAAANIFLGQAGGNDITTGTSNTALGYMALVSTNSGNDNVAFGAGALARQQNSSGQIAIGSGAMAFISGTNINAATGNIAIGYLALRGGSTPTNNTGDNNTVLGYQAAATGGIAGASGNTIMGAFAATGLSNGSSNTIIGEKTALTLISGNNNIVLGANADVPVGSILNWLNIGNAISGSMTNTGSMRFIGGVRASGIVTASYFEGDGSRLTGIASGGGAIDRITSGTNSIVAQTGGLISITTNNVNTGYFNSNGVLTVPGISSTSNLTSVTTLYASGKIGVKTATPAATLSVSGSIQLSTDNAACGSTLKGALQYTNQTLQVCDGVSWTSVASFPGTVPTTPGSGGIGYIVMTSTTFNGNLGGVSGANTKCYNDLNTYSWKNKPGTLDSSKVKAFICDNTTCNGAIANVTYYFANAGNASTGGAFFTTGSDALGPGDNYQWDGSNRFGSGAGTFWTNRGYWFVDNWQAVPLYTTDADTCSGWTSSSNSSSGVAGVPATTDTQRWLGTSYACNQALRLVCMVHP